MAGCAFLYDLQKISPVTFLTLDFSLKHLTLLPISDNLKCRYIKMEGVGINYDHAIAQYIVK